MTEANALAMPDRIAIDAKGFGWRVWDDEPYWSMVPTNPDNSPIPQPVTWFVRAPSREEAELAAVTDALCTNGADRLLELVGEDNRREAIACLTGVARAAVARQIDGYAGGQESALADRLAEALRALTAFANPTHTDNCPWCRAKAVLAEYEAQRG